MREVESRGGRHGRPRVRRLTLALCVLVGVAASLVAVAASPAEANEYSITSVRVDATVEPTGDVRITETRTLDFSGSFHYVYWDLSTRGSEGIEVRGASGPDSADSTTMVPYKRSSFPAVRSNVGEIGTYGVSDGDGVVTVQLNFEVTDATASFAVDYVAKGAAKRWSDTAELYWKFIGDETAIESRDVRVMVHLPDDVTRDQVRAWAHGPLWGTVTIEPDASVVMAVDPLPAFTFVEGRILFPGTALSTASASTTPKLDEVLAEEQRFADEANRSRLWARVKLVLWGILGVGLPVVALVLVLVLYFRHGREPKTQFKAQYLRDFPQPQLPPALAAFIWRMGSVGRDDATATLLDLVNRKVIDLERVTVHKEKLFGKDETTTYRLTLHDERIGDLLPFEQQLVEFLFHDVADGSQFVLSELKDLAKKHRTAFAKGYSTWTSKVREEGRD
ncbi:MAG: DUF2207 domain-containing protein, partial [Thermoleophilia bacterium]|nr:DUF2207 domain-containing protein [Thermoleophilia bacterium]